MGASCYFCSTGQGTPIPEKEPGDAIGVCRICHVLSCQAHGTRDKNVPRWVCVLCDATILTIAGVLQSDSEEIVAEAIEAVGAEFVAAARQVRSAQRYFAGRREDVWQRIVNTAQESSVAPLDRRIDRAFRTLWESLSDDGRLLIGSAVAMARVLNLPDEELVDVLQRARLGLGEYA